MISLTAIVIVLIVVGVIAWILESELGCWIGSKNLRQYSLGFIICVYLMKFVLFLIGGLGIGFGLGTGIMMVFH